MESIRSLSLPAVSTVNVSAAGNLMAVLVSPVWTILSAIDISPCAVIIPTESILVTSSYVNVPAIETFPDYVILLTLMLWEPFRFLGV